VSSVGATHRQLVEPFWQGNLNDYVTAIAWSPNGQLLAASSAAGEVVIVDVEGRSLRSIQAGNGQSLNCLGFSQDGQFLAAGGQEGCVKIWQIEAGNSPLITTIENPSVWIDHLAWNPKHNEVAFSLGRDVQIWDVEADKVAAILNFEASSVLDLAWHPQGEFLSAAGHRAVKTWNREDWNRNPTTWELIAASVAIAWSPNGDYLASGNMDRTLLVWQWGNPYPWQMQGFPGKVRQLAWSELLTKTGAPLLVTSSQEGLIVWAKHPDESVGWGANVLNLHEGTVQAIAFQPGTGLLASAASDGWIGLWQQASKVVQILEGAPQGFSCLAWQPSGQKLAAGGQNGELLIWSQSSQAEEFG
jgi:WD40 repeat protein